MMTTPQQAILRVTNNKLWLFSLFPALFISDILYGGIDYFGFSTPVSPGAVLRGFLFLLSVFTVLKYSFLLSRSVFVWVLAIVLFALPSIMSAAFVEGNLVRDIYFLTRVIYGPFMVLLVSILVQVYRIEENDIIRFIEYAAYVLGLSLLISQLLGIQRETYGSYAYGNTGIFYAQNDLTLALGLALLAASYQLVFSFSLKRLAFVALSMFASLQIGTRGSLFIVIGCAMMLLTLLVLGRSAGRKKRSYWRHIRVFLSIVTIAGMAGIFTYGLNLHNQTTYQQKKIEKIAKGELPRSVLITAGKSHLSERAPLLNLTGEGITSFKRGVARNYLGPQEEKLVEVDPIDLFGASGIFFTTLIYSFFLVILFGSAKRFFFGSRDTLHGLIAAALLMYLAHSVLAGHAVVSPIPTTVIAGYAGLFLNLRQKEKGMLHRAA